jgi:hypothetical protein
MGSLPTSANFSRNREAERVTRRRREAPRLLGVGQVKDKMPRRSSSTGSELFIVDNSNEDWKVLR